jgi:hypothetical protein
MNALKALSWKTWTLLVVVVAVVVLALTLRNSSLGQAAAWQKQASPGRLSAGHAFLENNCAACHTTVKGVEAGKCITCHANNGPLLQRQPTAFHANVGSCAECHGEHQGIDRRPTIMDHTAFAKISLRQLKADQPDNEGAVLREQLLAWINQAKEGDRFPAGHPDLTPQEAVLNCAACHSNKDRHLKLFGQDCAQCHATTQWTIPAFRHPPPQSMDCAQCHQAPPSHYMEHFRMVSMKVAGKPRAQVNQCFLCHQTTSWNDIKGVGWHKHH